MQLKNLNQSFGKKQCQSLKSKMNWFKKLIKFITPPSVYTMVSSTTRARNEGGRYVADDPTTPDINEAYTQVKKRKKRSRKK